jgi:hypothetical protein
MSSLQNTAAWLPGIGKRLEVGPSEIPVPNGNELLIEVSKARPGFLSPLAWKLVDTDRGPL